MGPPERRSDGFRERGREVTRLETFVDAAFAFAVTLLVIAAGSLLESVADLVPALERIPAFAAAFALIAVFWSAHDTWSRRHGLADRATTVLSLLLVFLVLIYVYPLRMLFESFFTWVSGGRLGDGAGIRTFDDLRTMFVAYGLCFTTLAGVIAVLYRHAWRRRAAIGLDAHQRATTLAHAAAYGYFVLLATGSVVVALAMPTPGAAWLVGLPGFLYFGMFASFPLSRAVYQRALAPSGGSSR
jgi:uncharacterized membrane protein